MKEKDKNRDGKITLDEFLDDLAGDQKSDWYMVEKNRYEREYDKDRNGFLEGSEIASWLVTSLHTTAAEVYAISYPFFKFGLLNLVGVKCQMIYLISLVKYRILSFR